MTSIFHTGDVYIRQSAGTIQYSVDASSWIDALFPITFTTSQTNVYITSDLKLESVNDYFIIEGEHVHFNTIANNNTMMGPRRIITISGVTDYPGLIQHGTSLGGAGGNVFIENIAVVNDLDATSTIVDNGGWICQEHFGKGNLNKNPIRINNCYAIGEVSWFGGGIVGANAVGCAITACYCVGDISPYGGGILGADADGNGSITNSINQCYSIGHKNNRSGGIVGGSVNNYNINNCYSVGLINSGIPGGDAGGIVGAECMDINVNNCYAAGTNSTEVGSSLVGYLTSNVILVNSFYESTWSDDSANTYLTIPSGTNYFISVHPNTPWLLRFNVNFYNGATSALISNGGETTLTYTGKTGNTFFCFNNNPSVSINSMTGQLSGTTNGSFNINIINGNLNTPQTHYHFIIGFTLNVTQDGNPGLENIQSFTPTQITALTQEQILTLTPSQISTLTTNQVSAFTPTQLGVFSSEQIGALTSTHIMSLSQTQISAITQLNAFTSNQFQSLTPTQITAITPTQIQGLTLENIQSFAINQIQAFTPEQIQAFTVLQLQQFTSIQINALTELQIQSFTPEQTSLAIRYLGLNLRPGITSILTPTQISLIDYNDLSAMISYTMTPEQIQGITQPQLLSLSSIQVGFIQQSLTPTQLSWLDSTTDPIIIQNLSPQQISELTEAQISNLTSEQIITLTIEQISALTPEQIFIFAPSQLSALTKAQSASLTTDQLIVMTANQIYSLQSIPQSIVTVLVFKQILSVKTVTSMSFPNTQNRNALITSATTIIDPAIIMKVYEKYKTLFN